MCLFLSGLYECWTFKENNPNLSNLWISFQRRQIVNGIVIPTDEECDYPSDSEKEVELSVSLPFLFMVFEA